MNPDAALCQSTDRRRPAGKTEGMDESSRLLPLARDSVPEFEPIFAKYEDNTGTLPNNILVMARSEAVLRARAAMFEAFREAKVDRQIRDLVFLMASLVTGCRYCQAHRSTALERRGADVEKIDAVWEFETSPLFGEKERAAIRFARDSAIVPNAVTDEHFVELRRHFTEEEIVELMAQSCQAAWSNRWNDTMGTPLEPDPLATMARLAPGWDPGKHSVDTQPES
jgi:uncharacterized peroxidase-related enzyme